MNIQKTLTVSVPVSFEFPPQMVDAVAEVFSGEYESGYFGRKLTIVDMGANVGSFSLWANLRWPQSTIHAYEPHPETFAILSRNLAGLSNITCHNQAVYTGGKKQLFFSRYTGDGEAGLVEYMGDTFEKLSKERIFEVSALQPKKLPQADIVKIDVEGAEAEILENMNLKKVSLILMEYQNLKNKKRIMQLLKQDFFLHYVDSLPWRELLAGSEYRSELQNDYYGHMFFVNKQVEKLGKLHKM